MREFRIQSNEAGQRFDKYLKKLLSEAPNSFVYKMLRKKNITLNGKKSDGSEKLAAGDMVKLFLSDETFDKFAGKDKISARYESLKHLGQTLSGSERTSRDSESTLRNSENTLRDSESTLRILVGGARRSQSALPVLYEDADILIVNKPAGMLSQKAKPSDVSANEYILHYLFEKGNSPPEFLRHSDRRKDLEGSAGNVCSIKGADGAEVLSLSREG